MAHTNWPTALWIVCLLSVLGAGTARAQFSQKHISAVNAVASTQPSNAPALQVTPVPADGELKLVVALFRHGVRAPLKAFSDQAGAHSKDRWPDLVNDWHVDSEASWGDLTPQGFQAATALGASYASYYSQKGAWPNGFKAYLWADGEDERTLKTAQALARGLQGQNIKVEVEPKLDPSQGKVDPLFHPFKAGCGTPDPTELDKIVNDINNNCQRWINEFKSPTKYNSFNDLYYVLGCDNSPEDCRPPPPDRGPLKGIAERASVPSLQKRAASPIKWEGQFSYASSATEAFLLEYANGMTDDKVGWGRVSAVPKNGRVKLGDVLRLHEFYFDQTERRQYLALIAGSNLVREILDQIDRKAGRKSPTGGQCPRAGADSQFVGLVGHDTNLANVGSLLGLQWAFDDKGLPPDTLGLPPNDALPAGALVFELRQRGGNYFVRIQYVTQSLSQMRMPSSQGDPYRLAVDCRDQNGKYSPCGEMSLDDFNTRVTKAIGDKNQFLSGCQGDGLQVCPSPTPKSKVGND